MIETSTIPGGIHGGDPGASPYLFFRVDEIEAAAARVRELGGQIEEIDDRDDDDARDRPKNGCDDQGPEIGRLGDWRSAFSSSGLQSARFEGDPTA